MVFPIRNLSFKELLIMQQVGQSIGLGSPVFAYQRCKEKFQFITHEMLDEACQIRLCRGVE